MWSLLLAGSLAAPADCPTALEAVAQVSDRAMLGTAMCTHALVHRVVPGAAWLTECHRNTPSFLLHPDGRRTTVPAPPPSLSPVELAVEGDAIAVSGQIHGRLALAWVRGGTWSVQETDGSAIALGNLQVWKGARYSLSLTETSVMELRCEGALVDLPGAELGYDARLLVDPERGLVVLASTETGAAVYASPLTSP